MRALFDTNVFISYLLPSRTGSTIMQIVEAAFSRLFTLLIAQDIADEFSNKVVNSKYLSQRIPREEADALLQTLLEVAEVIPAISTGPDTQLAFPVVTRDPKDDYLLAYALVGQADYLVTGDADLSSLDEVEGVKIVTPAEFLSVLQEI